MAHLVGMAIRKASCKSVHQILCVEQTSVQHAVHALELRIALQDAFALFLAHHEDDPMARQVPMAPAASDGWLGPHQWGTATCIPPHLPTVPTPMRRGPPRGTPSRERGNGNRSPDGLYLRI